MANWLKKKFKDICSRVDYGFTASASEHSIGPKFLRITDVVPPIIDWKSVPCCKISEADKNKYLLDDGDIVVARTGATTGYAKCLKNPHEAVFASYLVRFRVNESNDKRFVGHVIQSKLYKEFITKNLGGSAQPQANAQILGSYELSLPEKEEQSRIASVLSSYDDLIENNEKRIKALEEMAQLLYTEWFVKFKFPGHEKVKMVDSGTEYGLIPEGWEVKNLGDVADVLFGHNFKSNLFNENSEGVRIVRIRDVLSGDTETFTPENVDKKYLIEKGDLLIGMDGIFHMSMWFTEGCFLNQRVVRIRSERVPASFICESIKKQLYFFQKTIVGATVGHLSNGNIKNFKILMPNIGILNIFRQVTDLVINLKLKNQSLSKARDLLIPQLVTGKRILKNIP